MVQTPLPIDAYVAAIVAHVRAHRTAVVVAPPVVVPVSEPPPCDTPRRKDVVWPGARASALSGSAPKKSLVVCCGVVGRAAPSLSRNSMPGYPPVLQAEPVFFRAKPSSPWPVAPCPPRNDSARPEALHWLEGPARPAPPVG